VTLKLSLNVDRMSLFVPFLTHSTSNNAMSVFESWIRGHSRSFKM